MASLPIVKVSRHQRNGSFYFGALRRFLLDRLDVVMMQDCVEEHRELPVVLPAVTRISRKKDYAALARWNVNDRGAVASFGDAAHQSAQNRFVRARESHQDLLFAVAFGDGEQRAVGVTHRDRFLRIAVKDRMRRLQNLSLDNGAGRVKLRRRASGFYLSRQ